jgi:small nuclear ribonucleoprotein (snRNP)-like protein
MDGWKYWAGRTIFVRLKNGRVYSGYVTEVDDSNRQIIFISIVDKFGKRVTFVHSEVLEIKEEVTGDDRKK